MKSTSQNRWRKELTYKSARRLFERFVSVHKLDDVRELDQYKMDGQYGATTLGNNRENFWRDFYLTIRPGNDDKPGTLELMIDYGDVGLSRNQGDKIWNFLWARHLPGISHCLHLRAGLSLVVTLEYTMTEESLSLRLDVLEWILKFFVSRKIWHDELVPPIKEDASLAGRKCYDVA